MPEAICSGDGNDQCSPRLTDSLHHRHAVEGDFALVVPVFGIFESLFRPEYLDEVLRVQGVQEIPVPSLVKDDPSWR